MSKKLSPQEFCSLYLPSNWCEKDLQLYCQRVIKIRHGFGLLMPADEVSIKTPGTTKGRRSDLETWSTIYEVKCFLDYDKIYHAVAQTELYSYYGSKIFGVIPKRRVVIGVAPPQYELYNSAKNLAKDFSSMRGITVLFINEHPQWHMNGARGESVNKVLLGIILFLSLAIAVFLLIICLK